VDEKNNKKIIVPPLVEKWSENAGAIGVAMV